VDTAHDLLIIQIIEGAITIAFGIIAWFFLPNFPDQNTFLTQEETDIILQRVEKDRGDSVPDALSMEKLFSYLLDWKLWTIGMVSGPFLLFGAHPFLSGSAGLMYMCATLPAYAIRYANFIACYVYANGQFSLFVTIILRGMGWSISASLLLVRCPFSHWPLSI